MFADFKIQQKMMSDLKCTELITFRKPLCTLGIYCIFKKGFCEMQYNSLFLDIYIPEKKTAVTCLLTLIFCASKKKRSGLKCSELIAFRKPL